MMRVTQRRKRWSVLVVASMALLVGLGCLVSGGQRAEARRVPEILRPGTKPWFFQFELGPAIKLSKQLTQFKLAQSVGYHLFGGSEGPAIGGSLQESFGDGVFQFQMGPRFWWDIQPIRGLGWTLAPVAQMGYAVVSGHGASASFFNLQFGLESRLVLNDAAILFFRMFTIDLFIGDNTGARYDMMFGGGITL